MFDQLALVSSWVILGGKILSLKHGSFIYVPYQDIWIRTRRLTQRGVENGATLIAVGRPDGAF
jgi:hypothetical protein